MAGTLSVNICRVACELCGQPLILELLIFSAEMITEKTPAVLIIMTIDTEVFPIGTIRGIISGVPIFMMDSQKLPVFRFKLSSAFGADEVVNFKRLFPVIAWRLTRLFQFSHNIFYRFFSNFLYCYSLCTISKFVVSHVSSLLPSRPLSQRK